MTSISVDSLDIEALRRLMVDGRVSWAELGRELGLSPAATAERVKRLEREGLIAGFSARLDPAAAGLGITAFVSVTLESPAARPRFLERVAELAEVQEAHHVAGDHDYLLKVRTAGLAELDRLINEGLKEGAGVVRSQTTIALGTAKETPVLPLPDPDA